MRFQPNILLHPGQTTVPGSASGYSLGNRQVPLEQQEVFPGALSTVVVTFRLYTGMQQQLKNGLIWNI